MNPLRVNEHRLWRSLVDMGQVGGLSGGGCCRLALSPEDAAGRDLFIGWCREAGCEIRFDAAGNIFARRPGRDAALPAVATGSHLDTQPHGGNYDGIYGVLAGLEVFRTLNDAGVETQAPLETIVWTNEEAVRFLPPSSGAMVYVGQLDAAELHGTQTTDGTTVLEDLRQGGFLGPAGTIAEHPLSCLIEAHIEQGPILEREGLTIGVVSGIQGARILLVEVLGEDAHAGTTPMDMRHDAMVGAAEIVAAIDAIAAASDPATRLTVGRFDVSPNASSTVAGAAAFHIDLRHPSDETLARLQTQIAAVIDEVAGRRGLRATMQLGATFDATAFDEDLLALIETGARELGYAQQRMLSGAGHDAGVLAGFTPTAMIFVPCEKGISHNEAENATPSDLAAGASVLLYAMLARAVVSEKTAA